MADKVQQEFRSNPVADGAVAVRDGVTDGADGDRGSAATPSQGSADTSAPAEGGDPAAVVESELDREKREAREWLESVDATEIVNGAESTAAYRRANAVFDPAETELQLAEFWEFQDASYERDGRF